MNVFVASDIGGTFTDTVVLDADGTAQRYKAPTTPDELVVGVLDTFKLAAAARGVELSSFIGDIRLFSHGTTVATNALLQRRGARTGVLHTAGFGDTLAIMRGYKAFGLGQAEMKSYRTLTKRLSVIDPALVREIPERINYLGEVLRPLDEEATRAAIRELVADGVTAIAVCLLWCTANPDHERRVAELIAEEAPDVYVSVSGEILARINEYARSVTTATNAFLGPEVRGITASLRDKMREAGVQREPLLMQSNGGLATVAHAGEKPVEFLLSGPVGGVVGCGLIAEQIGERNVITTDMGGTSFDVGLIVDGRPLLQATTTMADQPIGVPSVAVQTIGAGGGSIAQVVGGILRVGPESAGAVPGPAAYGLGGERPTVTDADVVLGLVNPDTFLGGRRPLDRAAAEAAIRTHVAEPLGLSLEDAAYGIKRIVDAKLVDLVRQATIHKGFDPRGFALVAFGGAGPVHAHALGEGLAVKQIVVPMTASVHSAFGIAASDMVVTRERSAPFRTPPGSTGASAFIDPAEVNAILDGVQGEASALLEEQGMARADIEIVRYVDMRFRFQIHELTIEVGPEALDGAGLDDLVERFIVAYELRFGKDSAFTAAGVELVNWRAVATGRLAKPLIGASALAPVADGATAEPARRDRVFFGEWHDADVHHEDAVAPGAQFPGPAIIELADTNIVIGPGQHGSVDAHGNVLIVSKA